MTVSPSNTAEASVNADVAPVLVTDETATGDPLTVTVNALVAGTAAANVSLKPNSNWIPLGGMRPPPSSGGVTSGTCVELFATAWSVNDAAWFPATS